MKKHVYFLVVCVVCINLRVFGEIRITNYNLAGEVRSDLSTVLQAIGNENNSQIQRPIDILLLQEQTSVSTTTQDVVNKLNALYGAGAYDRGTLNGDTTGAGRPGIVYRKSTIELLEEVQVNSISTSGAARATIRYKVKPAGYTSPDAIIYIYDSHFKASDSSTDQSRRAVEAQQIRNDADLLGDGVNIIYTGDLNLYDSSEPAWQILTGSGNGQASDPANRVGSWHNSYSFTDVHTQSPATTTYFPGQITGGVDDRFDFQLLSGEMLDGEGISYISGTYHTFGNNNTHGLNNNIGNGTGAAANVLLALEKTTDHLPVVADYRLPAKMEVTVEPHSEWPIVNDTVTVGVTVDNVVSASSVSGGDELDYTLTCTGSIWGTGSGTIQPLSAGNTHYITLDTSTPGTKAGQVILTATSTAAQPASYTYNINYTVIDSGATVEEDFGWEVFEYKNDPNALVGSDPEISYELVEPGRNDSRSLQVQADWPGTYSAVLAVVTGLIEDDQVDAALWAKKKLPDTNGTCLWAEYITNQDDITSTNGTALNCSLDCGTSWTLLNTSWDFDSDNGQNQAMVIKARISDPNQIVTIDDLTIQMPMHCQALFPQPTTVNCVSIPEKDFNGDCVVDLTDIGYFSQNWLDGELGAERPWQYPEVVITGILDGTITSRPRVIELYVNGLVDLSQYSIERSVDGGAWSDNTQLSGIYENEFVYLIGTLNSGVAVFDYIFGTEGGFANHALESSIVIFDGNDAFRLICDSTVIDQVYPQTSLYEYTDSYMYRYDFTGPDFSWVGDNWMIPGNNTVDGLSFEEIAQMIPFGTYVYESTNCTQQQYLDYNNDCQINLPDLVEFLGSWLDCNYNPSWVCE